MALAQGLAQPSASHEAQCLSCLFGVPLLLQNSNLVSASETCKQVKQAKHRFIQTVADDTVFY